jgi:formate dehydrogenase assembly factor FdhD
MCKYIITNFSCDHMAVEHLPCALKTSEFPHFRQCKVGEEHRTSPSSCGECRRERVNVRRQPKHHNFGSSFTLQSKSLGMKNPFRLLGRRRPVAQLLDGERFSDMEVVDSQGLQAAVRVPMASSDSVVDREVSMSAAAKMRKRRRKKSSSTTICGIIIHTGADSERNQRQRRPSQATREADNQAIAHPLPQTKEQASLAITGKGDIKRAEPQRKTFTAIPRILQECER